MASTSYESVDDYIAAQPVEAQGVLERVRTTIRKALPSAVEGISYRIPVYKIDGRMVLYFAGFQHHYSIYPASARLIGALKEELGERVHSKATIRFSYDEKLPVRLISRIAKARAAEAAEQDQRANAKKRTGSKEATPTRRTTLSKKRRASSGLGKKRSSRGTQSMKPNARTTGSRKR